MVLELNVWSCLLKVTHGLVPCVHQSYCQLSQHVQLVLILCYVACLFELNPCPLLGDLMVEGHIFSTPAQPVGAQTALCGNQSQPFWATAQPHNLVRYQSSQLHYYLAFEQPVGVTIKFNHSQGPIFLSS